MIKQDLTIAYDTLSMLVLWNMTQDKKPAAALSSEGDAVCRTAGSVSSYDRETDSGQVCRISWTFHPVSYRTVVWFGPTGSLANALNSNLTSAMKQPLRDHYESRETGHDVLDK